MGIRTVLQRASRRAWHAVAGGMLGMGLSGGALAQAETPLAAKPVPQAWVAYAGLVRACIEQALAASTADVQERAEWSVVAQVWVNGQGTVSAFAIAEPGDAALARELQTRLVGLHVGAAPPPTLRLPIILRLDRQAAPAETPASGR